MADYIKSFTGVRIDDRFIQHVLWADDLTLISTAVKDSQTQLNGLSNFCAPNQMVVNHIKTKFMVFGRKLDTNLHFTFVVCSPLRRIVNASYVTYMTYVYFS